MSTFIDSIFDKIGNVILPKTVTKAVWGQTSGNRLDQELDGIEAALAQPNTGTNADRAYSAGKYIYHVKNKELYKAKSNIASGAAFNKASGGNVDVVNIGDQLQTISSDLADLKFVKLHSANTITVALSGGTGFIPWSTLDLINRTKYEYLPIVSCNGYFLGICYRFNGDGYTISGNDQTYSGNVAIQVFALQIPK